MDFPLFRENTYRNLLSAYQVCQVNIVILKFTQHCLTGEETSYRSWEKGRGKGKEKANSQQLTANSLNKDKQ